MLRGCISEDAGNGLLHYKIPRENDAKPDSFVCVHVKMCTGAWRAREGLPWSLQGGMAQKQYARRRKVVLHRWYGRIHRPVGTRLAIVFSSFYFESFNPKVSIATNIFCKSVHCLHFVVNLFANWNNHFRGEGNCGEFRKKWRTPKKVCKGILCWKICLRVEGFRILSFA